MEGIYIGNIYSQLCEYHILQTRIHSSGNRHQPNPWNKQTWFALTRVLWYWVKVPHIVVCPKDFTRQWCIQTDCTRCLDGIFWKALHMKIFYCYPKLFELFIQFDVSNFPNKQQKIRQISAQESKKWSKRKVKAHYNTYL